MLGKTAAIWLVLASAALAQNEDEKKKDEEVKARFADFKKELKAAKSDKDVAHALTIFNDFQHPKVLAELKSYLSRNTEVAVAAAEQIGKYKKDKDAAEALMAAASSRKDKDGIKKCLCYAGDTEFKGIASKLIAFFRNKETDAAKEAIDSCAKLRTRDAIEPLLNLWRELDGIKEEKNGGGGGGLGGLGALGGGITGGVQGSMQDEQLKRKRDLTPAVEAALKKITGEDFKDLKEANEWWRKNKATFKDPE